MAQLILSLVVFLFSALPAFASLPPPSFTDLESEILAVGPPSGGESASTDTSPDFEPAPDTLLAFLIFPSSSYDASVVIVLVPCDPKSGCTPFFRFGQPPLGLMTDGDVEACVTAIMAEGYDGTWAEAEAEVREIFEGGGGGGGVYSPLEHYTSQIMSDGMTAGAMYRATKSQGPRTLCPKVGSVSVRGFFTWCLKGSLRKPRASKALPRVTSSSVVGAGTGNASAARAGTIIQMVKGADGVYRMVPAQSSTAVVPRSAFSLNSAQTGVARGPAGVSFNTKPSTIGTTANSTALVRHPFSDGGTHITTTHRLTRHPDSPTIGGPNGLFIAPSNQVDSLLARATSRADVEIALGLDEGDLIGGDLIRFDVVDPFGRSLGLPTDGNDHFRPGVGLTTGNLNEGIIDSPLLTDPGLYKIVVPEL